MALSVTTLISTAEACIGKNRSECNTYFDENFNDAWCAWFVRMCGKKATNPADATIFGSSNVASALHGAIGQYGQYELTGSNFPKVGDLAFINPNSNTRGGSVGHVGIITNIGAAPDKKITVVSGNLGGKVKQVVHKKDGTPDSGYSGYGTILNYGTNS
jgi:hypothetical protein